MANLSSALTTATLVCAFLHAGIQAPRKHTVPRSVHFLGIQQSNDTQNSLGRFAGTWEGKCQDGRTFVLLTLKQDSNRLNGTVSIGNMHGDNQGGCMMVLAPPAPEHAQTIIGAEAKQNTLSFNGAKRPDGSYPRFELTLTEKGEAQLKLMGSPVEVHPWQLAKASTPAPH